MESFIFISMGMSLFLLGIALGAIIENRRIKTTQQIISKIYETQELLLPLGNKITHMNINRGPIGTLVDYEMQDPDATLEIPVYEKLEEEKWQKKQKSWEDST
tara:strand:- start:4877 stop:5185 length:309 start_codon:yes stop_codon:yes gene_type:complete